MEPEAELLLRGDEASFTELVRLTRRRVFGIIYRFVGNAAEADDLAQEAYLRVWQARRRYRPEAKFSTWLYTIVARLCLNARAKKRPTLAPEPVGMADDRGADVRAAVLGLPDTQRLAITLRYFAGLSDQETAEAMDLTLAAVQSLLYRARKALLEELR